ncbi:MAG: sigma-54-dependent transcriptional regulator [Planctomycetota bacterium]
MTAPAVLLVGIAPPRLTVWAGALANAGLRVSSAWQGGGAIDRLRDSGIDVVVSALALPDQPGIDLLHHVRHRGGDQVPMLMVADGVADVEAANRAVAAGALGYLVEPVSADALTATVAGAIESGRIRAENRSLRHAVSRLLDTGLLAGDSTAMRRMHATLEELAATRGHLLIVGEPGSGKELVARRYHRLARGADATMIPLDCGAVPAGRLRAELFGHEHGAVPDADQPRIGMLELAQHGTLLLDDLPALPLDFQHELLRTITDRTFQRVGGEERIDIDVSIVACCTDDPQDEVARRRLSGDLHLRLASVRIDVPPLRERPGDIDVLIAQLLGPRANDVSARAHSILRAHTWPGNVRELQNVLRRADLITPPGEPITPASLPESLAGIVGRVLSIDDAPFMVQREQRIREFEMAYVVGLLRQTSGDVTEAARLSGMPRGTLYRLLKKHRVEPRTFR